MGRIDCEHVNELEELLERMRSLIACHVILRGGEEDTER